MKSSGQLGMGSCGVCEINVLLYRLPDMYTYEYINNMLLFFLKHPLQFT